jgi:hypothetical protein
MKRALIVTAALATIAYGAEAEAGVADDGVIVSVVTLGTLAGVANTISALVYSLDERSFDVPWIASSLFSSAVCGSMMVSFVVEAAGSGEAGWLILSLITGVLTGVPAYWTIKSAISEADPGERFDAPALEAQAQRPLTIDPIGELLPRGVRPAVLFPLGGTF